MKRLEIAGQKFGLLTPTEYVGESKWKCLCECGNTREVKTYFLRGGDVTKCLVCSRQEISKRMLRNIAGAIPTELWKTIGRGAVSRGLTMSVSPQQLADLYVAQDCKCALSGVRIGFRDDDKSNTASLDRIDNSLGYDIENVQWVHKTVNRMKNALSDEDFIRWCGLIYEKWRRNVH